MSPRRNSRREPARRGGRPAGDTDPVESWPDGDFVVRRVAGSASSRAYRCPGCDQEVRPGVPHVVAWPSGDVDARRHWHAVCWRKRLDRAPRVERSRNAPRYGR